MRSSLARPDGRHWVLWIGAIVLVLVIAAAIGLTIYGGTVRPVQHQVERVLPDDRFPK